MNRNLKLGTLGIFKGLVLSSPNGVGYKDRQAEYFDISDHFNKNKKIESLLVITQYQRRLSQIQLLNGICADVAFLSLYSKVLNILEYSLRSNKRCCLCKVKAKFFNSFEKKLSE